MLNILLFVSQWITKEKLTEPDAAADVCPSRIQRVWGGQWAAEQSSQSSQDERHRNKSPEAKQLGATLSPLLEPNGSSELILLRMWCRLRGSVCPASLHLPSPICPEASCTSRAARAPGFPLPISWGSQSSFLLFSNVQNILKMVEHSLQKHTPPVSTLFPESNVDSHTGCDEEHIRPPPESSDSKKWGWSHVRCLNLLNNFSLTIMCEKYRDKFDFFDFYSQLKKKSKCNNSNHIKLPFPIFKEKTRWCKTCSEK